MTQPRKYKGWIPDLPDYRDAHYKPKAILLPRKIDLRQFTSRIEDQRTLGSCTANALAGVLEYLELKDKVPFEDKARLFIYYNERAIEQSILEDSGAMIRDGIKSLASQGCCSEQLWPYDPDQFATRPPAECYQDALKHRITSYERLTSLHDMKESLASGFPFVFGFSVYSSFDDDIVAQTGMMPMPNFSLERNEGGHAIGCFGYDDDMQRLIIRNSWGSQWGDKGWFYMPYDYIRPQLASDFWMIRRQTYEA